MSAEAVEKKGPLAGIRVVEFKGLGPGPHAATLLADLGADVEVPDGSPLAADDALQTV